MSKKQKLELTWIGKEHRPRLEPRILLEEPERSHHAAHRVTDGDIFDNRLIHGDNLLALKALEQDFAGKVKCIYIDPPFNTQQAFEHYDDATEHSDWLRLIRDRAVILHRLLARDGTLFVHIDDNELGYLTVLLDEVFGRANRLYVVTFKQGSATGHKSINPGCVSTTNFLLIYAKNKASWTPNRVFTARERDERYGQFIENIEESCGGWRITTLMKGFAQANGITEKDARTLVKSDPKKLDDFVAKNARSVTQMARPDYNAVSTEARKMIDESTRRPDEVLEMQRAGYSTFYLKGGKRILFYSDKLKFIDGRWQTGEPLTTLWDDKWGQWVISKEFNAPMLAEAVCKLEGFTYAPSDTLYWQHGHSTERDFIYTTTANLSHDQLQQLSDEVGPERSLLVVCSAFRGRKDGYANLTVKKIPKAVLSRCEWDKDDYSLKVENLPKAPPKAGQMNLFGEGGAA